MNRTRLGTGGTFAAAFALLVSTASPSRAEDPALRLGSRSAGIDVALDAPVPQVWTALGTREGLESWRAARAEVDLRVGGTIRTTDDRSAKPDDASWAAERILAFAPLRMIATRPAVPDGASASRRDATWRVTTLERLGEQTRVRVDVFGFGSDAEDDAVREAVQRALDTERVALMRHFPAKPPRGDLDRVWAVLEALKGTWDVAGGEKDPAPYARWTITAGTRAGDGKARYAVIEERRVRPEPTTAGTPFLLWEDVKGGRWRAVSISSGARWEFEVRLEGEDSIVIGEYGFAAPAPFQRAWRAPDAEGRAASRYCAACMGGPWERWTRVP